MYKDSQQLLESSKRKKGWNSKGVQEEAQEEVQEDTQEDVQEEAQEEVDETPEPHEETENRWEKNQRRIEQERKFVALIFSITICSIFLYSTVTGGLEQLSPLSEIISIVIGYILGFYFGIRK